MAFSFSSTSFCSSKVSPFDSEGALSKINPRWKYNIHSKDRGTKNALRNQFLLLTRLPPGSSIKRTSRREASLSAAPSPSDYENHYLTYDVGPDRVSWLVRVLHDSAARFSLAVRNLELARTGTGISMAWIGVDVHAWHKHVAYQVAVYALLEAVVHVERFLSQNRFNHPSPVHKILSPNMNFLQEHIESQLSSVNPELVRWLRGTQLPQLLELFVPVFKKWSLEYAGSGVAGTVMALTCCASVIKLGPERVASSSFSISIEGSLIELMNDARSQVPVDKFHRLAAEAGFEDDFLRHFGGKIIPCKNVEDIEFWIGLVLKKLHAAFERESVADLANKVNGNRLAVLGLFAYLGRESRLFVSRHSIRDTDEQIKRFLSNLECGIVFVYPEFSSISMYQLFMEVIVDEIGWVDFFASSNCSLCQERKRPKNHPVQAEAEIILHALLITCYDVITGFAHYSNSTQQRGLYDDLSEFLLHSQSLLSSCLEDYWAAYDNTGELLRIGERNALCSAPSFSVEGSKSLRAAMEADDSINREKCRQLCVQTTNAPDSPEKHGEIPVKFTMHNFIKSSLQKLVSASTDVWIGTQLLFADIATAVKLAAKALWGHEMTRRESEKIARTIADVATLVPVTILMLIPVSAVGHAAIFAAIKRYAPFLIPSSFADERINSVKQLRTVTTGLEH